MKLAFPSRESVPEPFRDKASEQDGKIIVDIGDAIPVGFRSEEDYTKELGRVAEFRENNRGLNSRVEELTAKLKSFEGVDPEAYRQAQTRIAELEKKGVKGADDIQALVTKAVTDAVAPMAKRQEETEKLLRERDEQLAKDKETIARNAFEAEVTREAVKVGAQETAVADIVRRGMDVFRRNQETGAFVAMDGTTPMFGSDSKPLTINGWLSKLTKEAPHLFKPSGGGGATGSPAAAATGVEGNTYDPAWVHGTPEGQKWFLEHVADIRSGKLKAQEA